VLLSMYLSSQQFSVSNTLNPALTMESMFGRTDFKSLKMGFTTALVVSACVVDSLVIAYDGSVMGSVNVGQCAVSEKFVSCDLADIKQ
jgi:hypothetical protein